MSFSFNGSEWLQANSAPVANDPMTISVRFLAADHTGIMVAQGNSGSVYPGRHIAVYGTVASDPFAAFARGASVIEGEARKTSISWDTWQHGAGVFNSLSSRQSWLNGSSGTANTTTVASAVFDRLGIGVWVRSNNYIPYTGVLAECAIWSAALTAAEIASLAKGFKPTRISPQSLVFYAPLLRNLQDIKGGLALTNNNSATVADHPRVY